MLINTNLYNESTEDNVFSYINQINNNYNAIMEAARISELRYYNNTGKELFINEAAISKLFDAIINFFKSIIDKIKGLFSKGSKAISTYDTKEIIKKANEITDDKISFEMDCYDFTNFSKYEDVLDVNNITNILDNSCNFYSCLKIQADYDEFKIDDKLEVMEKNRAKLLHGLIKEDRVEESKRHQLLKDYFIGEKVKTNVTKSLITNESGLLLNKNIILNKFKANEKTLTNLVNAVIKDLESAKNKIDYLDEEKKKEVTSLLSIHTEIVKSAYNDMIDTYGVLIEACNLRINQVREMLNRARKDQGDDNS